MMKGIANLTLCKALFLRNLSHRVTLIVQKFDITALIACCVLRVANCLEEKAI